MIYIRNTTAIIPTNDYVFKKIFGKVGNEIITKGLLNSILEDKVSSIDLEGNTILAKEYKDEKLGILDVKAKIDDKYLCDIEMQVLDNKNIEKRIMYYWSKLYISGIKQGENYSKLNKTISILILNYEIENFKIIEKIHTEWKIREKDYRKTLLTDILEIHIIELPKLKKLNIKQKTNNNLITWAKFFVNPDMLEEEEMKSNKAVKLAKEELDKMRQDEYEERIAELRMKHIMDSKSLEEYGYDKGEKNGKNEMQKIIVRNMLSQNMKIEDIVKITGLTKEEIEKLEEKRDIEK